MITCPACRNPVDVPEDHNAETIRCGICWAEVSIGPRAKAIAVVEAAPPPAPEVKLDPFGGIPGRPVKAMAPLEDLLRNVAERLPNLFQPMPAAPAVATAPEPPSVAPKVPERRREEEGLRRKRGAASTHRSAPLDEDVVSAANNMSKIALMALMAIVVFIVGYYLMR